MTPPVPYDRILKATERGRALVETTFPDIPRAVTIAANLQVTTEKVARYIASLRPPLPPSDEERMIMNLSRRHASEGRWNLVEEDYVWLGRRLEAR